MTDHEDSNGQTDEIAATTSIAAVTNDDREKPTLEQLDAALLTLRRLDRELLLAHRLDKMSYRQMAEITGLSMKQIQQRMTRAICDLDRALCGQPRRRQRWWPF